MARAGGVYSMGGQRVCVATRCHQAHAIFLRGGGLFFHGTKMLRTTVNALRECAGARVAARELEILLVCTLEDSAAGAAVEVIANVIV